MVEVVDKTGSMTLLPPAPDKCQECACDHDPSLPHNRHSLYYNIHFKMKHGREPTWKDAMAHCTEEVKARWIEAMKGLRADKPGPDTIKATNRFFEEIGHAQT